MYANLKSTSRHVVEAIHRDMARLDDVIQGSASHVDLPRIWERIRILNQLLPPGARMTFSPLDVTREIWAMWKPTGDQN